VSNNNRIGEKLMEIIIKVENGCSCKVVNKDEDTIGWLDEFERVVGELDEARSELVDVQGSTKRYYEAYQKALEERDVALKDSLYFSEHYQKARAKLEEACAFGVSVLEAARESVVSVRQRLAKGGVGLCSELAVEALKIEQNLGEAAERFALEFEDAVGGTEINELEGNVAVEAPASDEEVEL
jgi:hypothetical protein